ncbi:hypothetical protein [Armatimonas sp.]|uniref:hypothetical protein n=1 Tax=Armatimonas sp. TaxID=1872638 RepID=UPI002869FDA3|nr:hypothetical protein [Armatimonas sp.]
MNEEETQSPQQEPPENTEVTTSESGEELFLTVPLAAVRLGIGERRAYRLTGKLSDSQKRQTVSDSGKRLTLVSVNTLAALLAGEASVEGKGSSKGVRQEDCQTLIDSQNLSETVRQQPNTVRQAEREVSEGKPSQGGSQASPDANLREIITRQDAEIKRLGEALQREQENLAAAQRLVDQSQQLQLLVERRAAMLENEVEKLRALPPAEAEGFADSPQGEANTGGGVPEPSDPLKAQDGAQKLPWWRFGRRGRS